MKKKKNSSLISVQERKKRQMKRSNLIFLIVLAIIIIQLIAYRHHILNALGRHLILCQNPPQRADVIVILPNWEETIVRVQGGADFYHKGLAPAIFIPRMERMEGLEEIKKQGIGIPENRDLATIVLERLGVPLVDIETSSQEVTSTWEDAEAVRDFIEEKQYKSVLLVTSKSHSRRAYLIFKDALKGKATVTSVPSPYDSYNPEGWWKREKDSERVILEYQKLLVYYWRKIF